jgi:hypothetical protein
MVGAALVGLLAIAGCGGGGDKADDTTSSTSSSTSTTAADTTTTVGDDLVRKVCDLVTVDDITAALHVTVEPGTESGGGGVTTVCSYATADESTTVEVTRHEPVGDLIADTLAGDPKAEAYPGILEEAVIQLEMGQITVRVKDVGLVIHASPAPDEVALVQLARVGAGKMV